MRSACIGAASASDLFVSNVALGRGRFDCGLARRESPCAVSTLKPQPSLNGERHLAQALSGALTRQCGRQVCLSVVAGRE